MSEKTKAVKWHPESRMHKGRICTSKNKNMYRITWSSRVFYLSMFLQCFLSSDFTTGRFWALLLIHKSYTQKVANFTTCSIYLLKSGFHSVYYIVGLNKTVSRIWTFTACVLCRTVKTNLHRVALKILTRRLWLTSEGICTTILEEQEWGS